MGIRRGAVFSGLLLIVPVIFLGGLARIEQNDRFCVSCHLHEEKFNRFQASVSSDLAGAHHQKKSVRCIDCHGGADPGMRARVWAVAAVDAAKFLIGRYVEPDQMRLPLRDKECSQCHTPILKKTSRSAGEDEEGQHGRPGNAYHALRDHDGVKFACVRCHANHTSDGEARFQFLARSRVLPVCRECHKNL
jgi:predicted CXXCH cytochrome family protein